MTLAGWCRLEMQVVTQGMVRSTVVWFTFAPDRMQQARCTGRTFTDRQRITRKAADRGGALRHCCRANALPCYPP